jgi:hypothetical protein
VLKLYDKGDDGREGEGVCTVCVRVAYCWCVSCSCRQTKATDCPVVHCSVEKGRGWLNWKDGGGVWGKTAVGDPIEAQSHVTWTCAACLPLQDRPQHNKQALTLGHFKASGSWKYEV